MSQIVYSDEVGSKIIQIRLQKVILDFDVAELYGVETKHINQAVKNNPKKFPDNYILELSHSEKEELVKNFDRFNQLKHSVAIPKAFTEKGLYMLATILKSQKATDTTLSIIETFSKVKELSRAINQIPELKENSDQHKDLIHKTGELISDLIVPNNLNTSETEATIELNLAVVKFKYSVKKKS